MKSLTTFLCMSGNKTFKKILTAISFFSANKYVDLLLFSTRLFETRPTFLYLSIVGDGSIKYLLLFLHLFARLRYYSLQVNNTEVSQLNTPKTKDI